MTSRSAIVCVILILFARNLCADNIFSGSPFIRNYPRSAYNAGSQTWDIQQGENGMMYFANNEGLLEFDGKFWEKYALPNNSVIRALEINNNRIYVGGYNEIGYFNICESGCMGYTSLLDLIPDDLCNFDDVWKIYSHPDGIIFQSYNQIMIYKNDSIIIVPAPSSFHFSFLVNNEYYVDDDENGLMRYAMGNLYPLSGTEILIDKEIWGMLALGNRLLVATSANGVFVYDGNETIPFKATSSDFLKNNQIYSLQRISKQLIAFGTIQNGILITDNHGNPTIHLNMNDGLQNNTILCMSKDYLGNLWLGTDHGLDYIELNAPLTQISYNYGVNSGYTALIDNERIFLGTNQGLFTKHFSENVDILDINKKFKLIENTKGQVWSLIKINNTIFCGHNNGAYIINNNISKVLNNETGTWCFLPVPGYPDLVISGTYSGLYLHKYHDKQWKTIKKFSNFSESSRKMIFDNKGNLWVTHGYKGVFHIIFNDTFDSILNVNKYNSNNSSLPVQVADVSVINNEIVFLTNNHLYSYSEEDDDFIPNNSANNILNNKEIRSITVDKDKDLWYFTTNGMGVLRKSEDGKYTNITLPFEKLKGSFIGGFEFVYPYNKQNVLIGNQIGFIHYNPSETKNYNYSYSLFVRKMNLFNPDTSFFPCNNNDIVIDFSNNSTEFSFAANDFENPELVTYSTFLDGMDEKWSDWYSKNIKSYTNLNEGDYIFNVKARDGYGRISDIKTMSFKILPPFYRSIYAIIFYCIIIVIIIIIISFYIRKRIAKANLKSEKQQQELFRKKEEKLQREALEAEKKVIKMRNDKLREGIKQKDKELANATMQTIHKNEILITLREELKKIGVSLSPENKQKFDVASIIRKINREIDNEKQWTVFETHFESVHEEFLSRIKETFPNLTPRELKLCAYLRMNISSKEISVLMNISTRGVEISRYRLRKKLNLNREINLSDFIISF